MERSFFRLNQSSLPFINFKDNDGKILRILVDTGLNKNYIKSKSIPVINSFNASSIAGDVIIKHYVEANLFNSKEPIKFLVLPTLTSFDAILGNDSLKDLDAVIFTKHNYQAAEMGVDWSYSEEKRWYNL